MAESSWTMSAKDREANLAVAHAAIDAMEAADEAPISDDVKAAARQIAWPSPAGLHHLPLCWNWIKREEYDQRMGPYLRQNAKTFGL